MNPKKTSETLLGAFGGLVGLSLAYLASAFAPVSLPILCVLLSSSGIVAGLIFHRGRRRFVLECRIEENRLAAKEILDRIEHLSPENTPQEVRDDLWLAYRSLTRGFHKQIIYKLGGSSADMNPRPQLLNPPANQIPQLPSTQSNSEMHSTDGLNKTEHPQGT